MLRSLISRNSSLVTSSQTCKNHSEVCWDLPLNHDKSMCEVGQRLHTKQGWSSKWVNLSSPTLPCWSNFRLELILWWTKQHDLDLEDAPCLILMQAQWNRWSLTLQKVANAQMVLYLNNATWHGTIKIWL